MSHTRNSSFLAGAGFAVLLCAGSPALAATAPPLGTTTTFAVLGGSTVTNTGPSVLNGNLGVWPGLAITGFPPGIVNGTTHAGDAAALQAQSDLVIAYNNAAGQACNTNLTGQDLGGKTLTPGAYCFSSSAQLTGTLILDALGDPNAIFVFQIGSTLTTASNAVVSVTGGASNCNIFWQVGSSATLGTTTRFAGNILALTSITLNTGANVTGRILARNGAVTLDTNTVGGCAAVCPLITVDPATLPTGVQPGVPYSVPITASGSTPDTYVFTVTGTLPPGLGLTVTPPAAKTVTLSGTPTTPGIYTFRITATDANGCQGFRDYTITINAINCPILTILPATLPNANVGAPYTQPITASGSTPDTYVYTLTGSVPPGLGLTPVTPPAIKTVNLAGTPTTPGTYTFTVTATDANGCKVAETYTMLINPAACPTITISPTTLPNPLLGVLYNQGISATGGTGSYIFTVTAGSLPPGLRLNPLTSTPTVFLTGIPTLPGNYSFTITATDGNGCPGTMAYTMTIGETAAAIPTLSGWGLMVLAALTGLVSALYLRRAA